MTPFATAIANFDIELHDWMRLASLHFKPVNDLGGQRFTCTVGLEPHGEFDDDLVVKIYDRGSELTVPVIKEQYFRVNPKNIGEAIHVIKFNILGRAMANYMHPLAKHLEGVLNQQKT